MPYFAYKARNARGELLQGVMESTDSGTVADQLFNTGIIPVEIVATNRPAAGSKSGWLQRLSEGRVSSLDVQLFSRQMYTLLKAGVPIMRALTGLQESAVNKGFARVLQEIRESLDAGRELSTAMRRHPEVFPPLYLSMVRVGETTGRLDEVFMRLFNHMEAERVMREQVRSALRYPMIVATAMVLAVALINFLVIPRFAAVYRGFKAELPMMTRMLIQVSDFALANWPFLLGLSAACFLALRAWMATAQGRYRWDRMKLKLPVAGSIMQKAALARFTRSFALASRSGVPIVHSLTVVAQTVDNSYIASRIEQMRDGVERGETILRTAATTEIFTPVVLQMIAVGEETGELDSLMEEIGGMYEREVDYELKTLASRIEPILVVGLGIIVLLLALGVFLPIWDLGRIAIVR